MGWKESKKTTWLLYFSRGFQSEDQMRGGHLLGTSVVAHPMHILWGGVNGRVHDVPLQMIVWDEASY